MTCPRHRQAARAVLSHCRPAATHPSGRRAHDRVDDRQHRGLGHREADAAHGPVAAHGPAAASRPAELGLARVRHARGLLAAVRLLAEIRRHAHARNQWSGMSQLSAHRPGCKGRRLGIHGPWLAAGAHAQRRGPARLDSGHHRGDSCTFPARPRGGGKAPA